MQCGALHATHDHVTALAEEHDKLHIFTHFMWQEDLVSVATNAPMSAYTRSMLQQLAHPMIARYLIAPDLAGRDVIW